MLAGTAATEAATSLSKRDATVVLRQQSPGGVESALVSRRAPLVLTFDDIAYRRPVGTYYEVYLNRPSGAPADPSGPYYAGNLALFGLGHAGPEGVAGGRANLDVTGVLADQRQRGLWSGGEVKVDLHPVGEETTEAQSAAPLASIGKIRLLGE